MVPDKHSSFLCSVFCIFDTTLPLQDGPTFIIVLRHFAEDRFEINLAISQRAKSSGPIDPALITAVNSLLPCWIEFRILYMKHSYPFVIVIDVVKIIEAL